VLKDKIKSFEQKKLEKRKAEPPVSSHDQTPPFAVINRRRTYDPAHRHLQDALSQGDLEKTFVGTDTGVVKKNYSDDVVNYDPSEISAGSSKIGGLRSLGAFSVSGISKSNEGNQDAHMQVDAAVNPDEEDLGIGKIKGEGMMQKLSSIDKLHSASPSPEQEEAESSLSSDKSGSSEGNVETQRLIAEFEEKFLHLLELKNFVKENLSIYTKMLEDSNQIDPQAIKVLEMRML
jgi:hypothetical protein